MKVRIIAVAGEVSAGKSEVAMALRDLLPDWEQLHIGKAWRAYAERHGLGMVKSSHVSDEVYRAFDEEILAQMRTTEKLLVEGRMAGVLARPISDALSVWLYAPLSARVSRYRGKTTLTSDDDAIHEIQYRDVRDRAKLRQVYGLQDYRDHEFYHLTINTGYFEPADAAELIKRAAERMNAATRRSEG